METVKTAQEWYTRQHPFIEAYTVTHFARTKGRTPDPDDVADVVALAWNIARQSWQYYARFGQPGRRLARAALWQYYHKWRVGSTTHVKSVCDRLDASSRRHLGEPLAGLLVGPGRIGRPDAIASHREQWRLWFASLSRADRRVVKLQHLTFKPTETARAMGTNTMTVRQTIDRLWADWQSFRSTAEAK